MKARGRAARATTAALVAGAAVLVAWPWATGPQGLVGLDRGNYAARIHAFSDSWSGPGSALPELTRWSGLGEPFVLYNGSLASCAGGALAALLEAAGRAPERAVHDALRAAWLVCDALAALLAFAGLRLAGAGRAGALVGSLAWGLVWPRLGESIHAANLEHAAVLALLPLAAGLVARIVRRPAAWRRPAGLLGVVLALVVPIHPGLSLILGGQVALAATIALLARRRSAARRLGPTVASLLLAAALGAAGSLWFWGPLLEQRRAFEDPGPTRPSDEATLLDYVDRTLWFSDPDASRFALSPDNYLASAYVGLTVVALGACAVAGRRTRRRALGALALGLASALVSLHPAWTTALFGPIHGLSAVRFAAPAALWACVAAALGVDALARALMPRLGPRARPLHVAAAVGALVALDLLSLTWGTGALYRPVPSAEHPLCADRAAALAPLWGVIARHPRGPSFGRVLDVPALELHEGVVVHGRPAADGLERHGWRPGARAALQRARQGVEDAVLGARTDDELRGLGPLLDRLAVRWVTVLAPGRPLPPSLPGLTRVTARGDAALYERLAPPGRVTVLDETDEAARLRLADGPAGPLEVARQTHARLRAAFVGPDGRELDLPITESDAGLVLVDVPAGPGELRLWLEPWAGAGAARALAWLALAGCLILIVRPDLLSRGRAGAPP
jgi:hypothetical protein